MSLKNIEINNFSKEIFDSIPLGLILLDSTHQIVFINRYAQGELDLEANIHDIDSLPESLNFIKNKFRKFIAKAPVKDIILTNETKTLCFEMSISKINMESQEYFIVSLISKLSDLKKFDALKAMQTELFQFKNLAAIGTMISGVAHELNNPISGISMSSQLSITSLNMLKSTLLKQNLPEEVKNEINESIDYCLTEIDFIKTNTIRAAKLVGDLLNYSKREKLELHLCHLQQVINETIELSRFQPEFAKVKIKLDCSEDLALNCDKLKIQQVIFNILKNAVESIPQSGEIDIICEAVSNYVIITISDNGCGIPNTNLDRLFTPFFTTKGPKGGTGLGLSISQRIIERHGGQITVESELNKGSKFIIKIPNNLE